MKGGTHFWVVSRRVVLYIFHSQSPYPQGLDGIFATDGEQWHHSRQLLRPQFAKDRVSDLQTFETHTQKVITIIKEAKGSTIDVQDLFFRMTLDVTTHFLLGSSVDSLSTPQVEFAEAFGIVQRTHANISRLGSAHPSGSHGTAFSVLTTQAGGFIISSPRRAIRRVWRL